jgi:hypothetical protein
MIVGRKKIILTSALILTVLLTATGCLFSWDSYDSVYAVVNNSP